MDTNKIMNQKLRVSILSNTYIPELKCYGPIWRTPVLISKIVSLMNRGIIVQFQYKNDVEKVKQFIDEFNNIADMAEDKDNSLRINRPVEAENTLKSVFSRFGKKYDNDGVPENIFDSRSDDELLEFNIVKDFKQAFDMDPKQDQNIDNDKYNEFKDRVSIIRKMTHIDIFHDTDNDFEDLELK